MGGEQQHKAATDMHDTLVEAEAQGLSKEQAKRREMFGDPEEYRERSQSALPPHLRTQKVVELAEALENADCEAAERQEKAATDMHDTLVEVDAEVGEQQHNAVHALVDTLSQAEVEEQNSESARMAKLEG